MKIALTVGFGSIEKKFDIELTTLQILQMVSDELKTNPPKAFRNVKSIADSKTTRGTPQKKRRYRPDSELNQTELGARIKKRNYNREWRARDKARTAGGNVTRLRKSAGRRAS